MGTTDTNQYLIRTGMVKLLEIKDSDIRMLTLQQCHDAVDGRSGDRVHGKH